MPITPTRAVVLATTQARLAEAGIPPAETAAALHAAEHALIALLPLVAACDRGDLGGVSTAAHPATGSPTLFVYDAVPGGAGFAERAHDAVEDWIAATVEAVTACACPDGCPSCVQSPRCGSGNTPLSKVGATRLLGALLADVRGGVPGSGR